MKSYYIFSALEGETKATRSSPRTNLAKAAEAAVRVADRRRCWVAVFELTRQPERKWRRKLTLDLRTERVPLDGLPTGARG